MADGVVCSGNKQSCFDMSSLFVIVTDRMLKIALGKAVGTGRHEFPHSGESFCTVSQNVRICVAFTARNAMHIFVNRNRSTAHGRMVYQA